MLRSAAWVLAGILLSTVSAGPSWAQSCCSPATTPTGAIAHPGVRGGAFELGVYAQHYSLAGGRRGTEDFDFPGEREANAQVITFAGRVGITDRFSASLLVPLNRRERSDVAGDGVRVSRTYSGLGDIGVLGYYRITSPLSRTEWTAGGGVKLATGESRAEDDTGELPEELQPGTGANDVLITSLLSHALSANFTLSGGFTWRLTGTLTKIDELPDSDEELVRQFRFGNELLYGFGLGWTPDYRWGFQLGLEGRHARPDRATSLNPDGTTGGFETLPSTGGERLWFAPTIRFAPSVQRARVSLAVLLPVYENLLGSQLATEPGVRFTLESSL
jgi:hypothetical protein